MVDLLVVDRRVARLRSRRAAIDQQLAQMVRELPTADPAAFTGALRALRALGSRRIPRRIRTALRARIAEGLRAEGGIDPRDLGMATHDDLAELLVRMLERVRYGSYRLSELRRKRLGLQGNFAGELFEQLVLEHRGIQSDLAEIAATQLRSLREQLRTPKGRFVDGRGAEISLQGSFGPVRRVTDIATWHGAVRRKFTDFAHVSLFAPSGGGERRIAFLTEVEVKLPRAAADFGDQMAAKQARFAAADRIEVRFDDGSVVSFRPEEVVVDLAGINRIAISTTRRPGQTWRFSFRGKRRPREAWLRVNLAIDVEQLRRMVALTFR